MLWLAGGLSVYVEVVVHPASTQVAASTDIERCCLLRHVHVCVAVLGVFPDGDATEEAAEFKAAAQAMRDDLEFGLVTDASMVPEAKGYVKTPNARLAPWLCVHVQLLFQARRCCAAFITS